MVMILFLSILCLLPIMLKNYQEKWEETKKLFLLLHDIGSIVYGRDDHHITGAKIVEKKLKELGYRLDKIEEVKKCILNHMGSMDSERTTIEKRIVTEADVMSHFDNVSGIFKAASVYKGKSQREAAADVRLKLQRKWKQLHFEKL
ncbi:MAG: HD domain-containing protein [Bacteroidota bacterium]